jgi:hypothetical protein
MTEEVTPDTVEEIDIPADADTAFIVIKSKDGTWKATVDVASAFTIERQATRADVKTGTREINEFLSEDDIARYTAARISAQNQTDTERATEGVRQALSDRDIL